MHGDKCKTSEFKCLQLQNAFLESRQQTCNKFMLVTQKCEGEGCKEGWSVKRVETKSVRDMQECLFKIGTLTTPLGNGSYACFMIVYTMICMYAYERYIKSLSVYRSRNMDWPFVLYIWAPCIHCRCRNRWICIYHMYQRITIHQNPT